MTFPSCVTDGGSGSGRSATDEEPVPRTCALTGPGRIQAGLVITLLRVPRAGAAEGPAPNGTWPGQESPRLLAHVVP